MPNMLTNKEAIAKANKAFLKKFWKFLVVDAAFLFLLFTFLLYSRTKIKAYFLVIGEYAEDITALQVALQQNSVDGLSQLQSLISIVEPIANKMMIFAFFIVPAVAILLWSVSQAVNYSIIENSKWFSSRYFLSILAVSIPFFVLALVLLNSMLEIFYALFFAAFMSWKFWLFALIVILLMYVAQVMYSLFIRNKPLDSIKKLMGVSVLKFHRLFPAYLAYAFSWVLIISAMLWVFVSYQDKNVFSIIATAAFMLPIMLLMAWFRVFFTIKAASG